MARPRSRAAQLNRGALDGRVMTKRIFASLFLLSACSRQEAHAPVPPATVEATPAPTTPPPPRPRSCLEYEPVVVTLRGTIITLDRYGPPNFGEDTATDQKVTVPVLKLDSPVNVCGDTTRHDYFNAGTYLHVEEMQVVSMSLDTASMHRHVVITGTLYEKQNAHHYTDVLIRVTQLRLADSSAR